MSRHLGSLVLAAVLSLTTAACSDTAEAPEPEPSSSPSDTPSSSPPTTEPPTTEPPAPTVSPASGPQLRQEHLSVRAPKGWSVTKENDTITGFARDDVLLSTLMIAEVEDPNPAVSLNLEQQARDAVKSGTYLRDPEILEPVEIDGVLWYHTSGQIDAGSYEDSFGTITNGVLLDITITTGVGLLSPAERQELVDSILASVEVGLD